MTEARRARVYEPGWKYTPAAETDIRKRFAAIKREQAKQQDAKVTPIKRGSK